MRTEHDCWWIRRKTSEISDDAGCLRGAGVPAEAIERAASLLHSKIDRGADPHDECGDKIKIGSVAEGETHDECFFCLCPVSPQLKEAVIQSLLELHATYLGIDRDWSSAVRAISTRLERGTTIRIRSHSLGDRVSFKAYPTGSGFFARLLTRSVRAA